MQHPHLQYKTEKEGRQGQGQPSNSLAQSPYFTFHLLEQEEARKEVYSPCHLAHLHLIEPLVLVFILPAFKPSLGEEG